eukprot:3272730-Rhodomonas_salina.4
MLLDPVQGSPEAARTAAVNAIHCSTTATYRSVMPMLLQTCQGAVVVKEQRRVESDDSLQQEGRIPI